MALRRLVRTPLVFWVSVAGLAVTTWAVVAGTLGRAESQAARFGSVRSAVVALRHVDAGAVVAAGDLESHDVPASLLPASSVASPADAVGRTVVAPLFEGQVVVKAQLAPEGLSGIAALLPPGTRALAVPTGSAATPLRKGDVVDVLATFDPSSSGAQEPTYPVATGATVVDVGPEAATVAVQPEEAKRVAFAVTEGRVTLAVAVRGSPAGGRGGRP